MLDGEMLAREGANRRGDAIDSLENVEPLEDLVIGSNREARVAEVFGSANHIFFPFLSIPILPQNVPEVNTFLAPTTTFFCARVAVSGEV